MSKRNVARKGQTAETSVGDEGEREAVSGPSMTEIVMLMGHSMSNQRKKSTPVSDFSETWFLHSLYRVIKPQ